MRTRVLRKLSFGAIITYNNIVKVGVYIYSLI